MDLAQLITVFAIVATNLGTVIFLHCHLDSKIDSNRKETTEILKGIQEEMKDFHTRLIKIEEARK